MSKKILLDLRAGLLHRACGVVFGYGVKGLGFPAPIWQLPAHVVRGRDNTGSDVNLVVSTRDDETCY